MNSDKDTRQVALGRVGCPIRTSRDHRSLASPPGFSQRVTSFIASQCQGIHQMPFSALDPGGTPNRTPQGLPIFQACTGVAVRLRRTHRRAQGQNPDPRRPRMKTLLGHAGALRPRAYPPRSHDKLSLHPSINTPPPVARRRVAWSSPNAVARPVIGCWRKCGWCWCGWWR